MREPRNGIVDLPCSPQRKQGCPATHPYLILFFQTLDLAGPDSQVRSPPWFGEQWLISTVVVDTVVVRDHLGVGLGQES